MIEELSYPAPMPRPPHRHRLTKRLVVHRLQQDPIGYFLELQREQGDLARVRFGRNSLVLVNDPELAREVLLSAERFPRIGYVYKNWRKAFFDPPFGLFQTETTAEVHLEARRTMQPAYRAQRIARYWPDMLELVESSRSHWQQPQTVELIGEGRLLAQTMGVKLAFTADLDETQLEVLDKVNTLIPVAKINASSASRTVAAFRRFPYYMRVVDAKEELQAILLRAIARHRAAGIDGDDLFSLLIKAADAEGLTEDELGREALGHIMSFSDSAGNTGSWALYLASLSSEILEKLREEARAVLTPKRREPPERSEVPYSYGVILEALRLYPPSWRIYRRAFTDDRLGDLPLKKGDYITVFPYGLHRDPRYWDQPDSFRPGRWLDGSARAAADVFMPWGLGPRKCPGNHFALQELLAVLLVTVDKYELSLPAGATGVEPEVQAIVQPATAPNPSPAPGVGLGLWMDVRPR